MPGIVPDIGHLTVLALNQFQLGRLRHDPLLMTIMTRTGLLVLLIFTSSYEKPCVTLKFMPEHMQFAGYIASG